MQRIDNRSVHPLAFAALLAGASLAMVYAMVQYSRARLESRDPGHWLTTYLLTWALILAIVIIFLGDDLRRNLPFLAVFTVGWFAVHWLILRFAIAVRDAPKPPPRDAPVVEKEQEVEEEEELVGSAEIPLTLFERAVVIVVWLTRWVVSLGIAMLLIVVGSALPFLHTFDARLAPYRGRLLWIFGIGVVLGWLIFMIAIMTFVLRGGQSGGASLRDLVTGRTNRLFEVIASSVALWLVCAIAFGIVVLPPGLKLLVIVAAAYIVIRFTSTFLRMRRTPSDR